MRYAPGHAFARSGSAAERIGSSRARSYSSVPARIATAVRDSRRRKLRSSDFTTSAPSARARSIPSCPLDSPSRPARLGLARNARTYEITLANGTKIRRTSSDPGRALLTGFVGGPPADRRLEQVRRSRTSRNPQDRAVLPQQQRRDAGRGRRSLHRVLQACAKADCAAGRRAAGCLDGRRALRSAAHARRARSAARVLAKAVAGVHAKHLIRARFFRFRDFELDVAAYELRRHGRAVRLERRPMDLLILLVARRGELVSRGEIVDRLWGKDVFVNVDTGVNTAISKVRQALRDSADAPVFVETVAGRATGSTPRSRPFVGRVVWRHLTSAASIPWWCSLYPQIDPASTM